MSLSGNTEKINELITKINALPEAGSGGGSSGGASVETCTVTFATNGLVAPGGGTGTVYFVDENFSAQSVTWENGTVITTVKGTIIQVLDWSGSSMADNATQLFYNMTAATFHVEGNATLTYYD